jgi:hypothetical protein
LGIPHFQTPTGTGTVWLQFAHLWTGTPQKNAAALEDLPTNHNQLMVAMGSTRIEGYSTAKFDDTGGYPINLGNKAHLQSSYSMLLSGLARKECANLKRMKSCFKEPLEIYQIANWRIINSSYILVGNSSN